MSIELREVEDECSKYFESSSDDWWLRDLSNSYEFDRGERLAWVIDGETDDSVLLLQQEKPNWWRLDGPDGVTRISSLLNHKFDGELPDDHFSLALLLMEWHDEPRGFVLSKRFLDDQQDDLDSFIVNKNSGIEMLKRHCENPALRSEAGKWELVFKVLDRAGGVSQWTAMGQQDPFSLETISVTPVLPAETFYYPVEF